MKRPESFPVSARAPTSVRFCAIAIAVLGPVLSTSATPEIAKCGLSAQASGDLVILNARLIDGTGAPARENVTIVVRAGRIEAIGTEPPPVGVSIIDAPGVTVLPGLIDAHVHLAAAPGSAFRHDTLETVEELNHLHLRAYLANGVRRRRATAAKPLGS